MHLASSLFALDEIVIPPCVMAPPAPPAGEGEEVDESVDAIIPYLPDWPELAAVYHTPVLSLPEMLSGGANIILIGTPGSGKTVALAYLASQIARRSVEVGNLGDSLPLLVHAADISLPTEPPKDPLQPLIEAIARNASALTLPRLPNLIRTSFEKSTALLLLDGMDELPPDLVDDVVVYLGMLLKKYPEIRVIASASPDS